MIRTQYWMGAGFFCVAILLMAACEPSLFAKTEVFVQSSPATTEADLNHLRVLFVAQGYRADALDVEQISNSSSGEIRQVLNYSLPSSPNIGMSVWQAKNGSLEVWFHDVAQRSDFVGESCEKYQSLLTALRQEFTPERVRVPLVLEGEVCRG